MCTLNAQAGCQDADWPDFGPFGLFCASCFVWNHFGMSIACMSIARMSHAPCARQRVSNTNSEDQ